MKMRKWINLVIAGFIGTSILPASAKSETTTGVSTMDNKSTFTIDKGCIIRGPRDQKRIALEFTGGYFADGGTTILAELKKRNIKASFYFIGDFYRDPKFKSLIERIRDEGHYLGPHSNKHPLYASWDNPPKLLINKQQFDEDLDANMKEIAKFGVSRHQARFFIPPYEHYTPEIAQWAEQDGMVLVNYTPGTRSNADYMEDDDPKFVPAEVMVRSIYKVEETAPDGLNGFMLLMHIGSGPKRTKDHLYDHLGEMLDELTRRGYQFVSIPELLQGM
jgi:peptidoglycan/xylan/chitin deacetylase (PgdA/CDA1 family)